MGLDVGPKSAARFAEVIKSSKTIIWNGPSGVFEFPRFAEGSKAVLAAAVAATAAGSLVIVGGGDTATLVIKVHQMDIGLLFFFFFFFYYWRMKHRNVSWS
jgi:phosphoglycerate kinase